MSVAVVTPISVECDLCGAELEAQCRTRLGRRRGPEDDPWSAASAAAGHLNWLEVAGKHFCPACAGRIAQEGAAAVSGLSWETALDALVVPRLAAWAAKRKGARDE